MAETLPCPGCKAELVLPALPTGQTVQCPRCQRVFEPGHTPPRVPVSMAAPAPHRAVDSHSRAIPGDMDALAEDGPVPPRYEPLRYEWKAPAALILLTACVASYVLQFYVHFEHSLLLRADEHGLNQNPNLQIKFGGEMADPMRVRKINEVERRWSNLRDVAEFSTMLHHVLFWPTVIFVVIWIHQAARNLRILQAAGLLYSPALAALSFFIPIVNLFQPFSVMQEIWRASDPRAARAPRSWQQAPFSMTARIWWLALLAAAALWLFAWSIGSGRLLQAHVHVLTDLCMIAAGVALIVLIRGIQVRQRERHARIYDDAA